MSHEHHKAHAPTKVRVYVLTVSDTRTEATNTGGKLCRELCQEAGHEIAGSAIVPDDPERVRGVIYDVAGERAADVLLITGGTGISRRDNTYEAVADLLDKCLDGFGELFRYLSYQEIGSAAMLSRAVAGLHQHLCVFALPGSPKAVRLALTKLILPELSHLVFEAHR
jgi:molybdenum cofactor biosynthesis protein B